MIDTLGQLPREMWSKWPRRERYFNETMQLIRSDVSPVEVPEGELDQGPDLETAFADSRPKDMGDEEAAQVLSLLRTILQYEPGLRPSTSMLLESAWFQSIE